MGLLDNKKRARIFYKYFSKIYDFINPIFYSEEMRKTVVDMAELKPGDFVLGLAVEPDLRLMRSLGELERKTL